MYQLHQAVDWQNPTDVSRLFADIHSRIRGKNPDAEPRWNAQQFREQWQSALEDAIGQVPLTPQRKNEHPVIWLMGSHSELKSKREQTDALQVSQVIAKVCLVNHFQIVSGASRLLDYLADEYENYRDYFNQNPEKLTDAKNEPLRKFIASEHALDPTAAPNPIILLGSLRRKGIRTTFDDAIGRFPDFAILIGGSLSGRSPEEAQIARKSKIPVLPVRFTGGTAATVDHTLNPKLDEKVQKLQKSRGKMDEFARLLVELIYDQLDFRKPSRT